MKFGGEAEEREEEEEPDVTGSKKFTLKKKTSLPSGSSSKGMPARRLKKL